MPRACPVEFHACCYTELQVTILDATGLSVEVQAGGYTNYKSPSWMPRACPVESSRWPLYELQVTILDATGLSRGGFTFAAM